MRVIDNNGTIYPSIREFARKTGCSRRISTIRIRENGIYYNKAKGIAARPVTEEKPTIIAPAPTPEVDEEYEAWKSVRGTEFKLYKIDRPADKKGYRYAIALFSDAHLEESVDPDSVLGLNSYDIEVAEERTKAYFANLANC